ncbi:hypothetical protein [Chondromyces crocatus]|nr:hypothetical protein [Chondromyces crocatus]
MLLTLAGAAGLVTSGIFLSYGTGRYEIYCDNGYNGAMYQCRNENDVGLVTAGWITLGTGLAAMAVGIPLWVIGGKRVPSKGQTTSGPASAPHPPVTRGMVSFNGSSVSAHFTF